MYVCLHLVHFLIFFLHLPYFSLMKSFSTVLRLLAFLVIGTSATAVIAQPANNECAGAVNLVVQPYAASGCPGSATGTTVAATASTVPASASFPSSSDDDVWYIFTATATAHVVRFCNVTFPVGAAVPISITLHPVGCTAADIQITGSNQNLTVTAGTANGSLTALTIGTTYHLRVMANGTASRVNFDVSILEAPNAPGCSVLNSPANGATNVAVQGNPLVWTAPVTGGPPTAYDLYFGTVNPPALLGTLSAPATTITIVNQSYNTTYYWYIVPKNAGGSATGCNTTIFSYTTGAAPAPPPNDECAGAISITNGAAQFVNPGPKTAESATQSQAAILCAGATSTSANDVWFSFTTDADGGDVTISVVPSIAVDLVIEGFTTAGQCTGASVCADAQVTAGPLTNGGETLTMTGLSLHGGGSADNTATHYFRVYRYNSTFTDYSLNITAAAGTALPLELKSFTGQVQGSMNVLNWETLTEQNVQTHIVERSADGLRWTEVGRVNAKGNSQVSAKYSLEDRTPLSKAYYRLRSVDFDGKESRSNSIVLTRDGERFGITSVYPSPTTDNVTVQFNSTEEEKVTVRIMDMTGRLVMQQVVEAVKDVNELPVTLHGLQAGIYSVTVSNVSGVSAPVRFVKQ